MDVTTLKKFTSWCVCYDSSLSWIDDIDWTCSAEYMKEKFRRGFDYAGNSGVCVYFYRSIDEKNQTALLNWIETHF